MRYILFLLFTLFSLLSFSNEGTLNIYEKGLFKIKLKKVNYYIINGEMNKAQAVINARSGLFRKKNLYHYYQAIFSYLNEDYQATVNHIKLSKNKNPKRVKHLCQIQVMSLFMLKEWKDLFPLWQTCAGNAQNQNDDDQFFLKSLLEVTTLDTRIFRPRKYRELINNPKLLAKWLKLASYTNNSAKVEEYLLNFPVDYYKQKEIKDLTAHLYYDNKKIQLAYELISDSNSKTAKHIESNLFTVKKNYRKSYEILKDSFQSHPLSKALLSRLILKSFVLEEFQDSLKYITHYEKVFKKIPIDFIWKKALLSLIKKDTRQAKRALNEYLDKLNNLGLSSLFSIRKFIALQEDDIVETLYYADKSCLRSDPSGCWLKIILKKNFDKLTQLKTENIERDSFLSKLKSGWIPPNTSHESFAAPVKQSEISRLDELERTKDVFFQSE